MTDPGNKIVIVIAVYNNAATLRDVVERAAAQPCSGVVVVDDGCTDCNVAESLNGLPVVILRHEKNLGKGEALKTAVKYLADRKDCRWMITLDADGQHAPEDIPLFLDALAADTGRLQRFF